ncbi:MAG: adenosylcobinamide amidohydrolase, partial [Deltaproteobacteria bacterium]|nr:adenosylcobinamide amidohydrolase [Deltaproteobacteria bacterium]
AGGMRRDLEYALNHQGCEPTGHLRRHGIRDPLRHRELVCIPCGLPPESCATMGTAANMHHAAIRVESFRELEVVAVATGGVETNAGRAGDPAGYYETPEGFEKLSPTEPPAAGTINTMLFISRPLTEGALTRTIMTATEAKCAVLQELNVNSRYSDGPATGTGTDQIIVAAPEPEKEGEYRLTTAGKHSKLGELIGRAVKAAIRDTLGRQNRLTATGQGNVKIHLERFGCDNRQLKEGICAHLEAEEARILAANYKNLVRDPVTVAAIAALVCIWDKLKWGLLPTSCRHEILSAQAALVAAAVGGRYELIADYREQLAGPADISDNQAFLALAEQALALGFADKWPPEESAAEKGEKI